MCVQRISAASRRLSLRFSEGGLLRLSPDGFSFGSFCRSLPAVGDCGGLDLDITLEFLEERLFGEGH